MKKFIEIIALVLMPLALIVCALFEQLPSTLILVGSSIVSLGLLFLSYDLKNFSARSLGVIATFTSVGSALRVLMAAIPGVNPINALSIIGGLAFGRHIGFLIGALSALVSNCILGQGVWTFWQMYAWGIIGWIAGAIGTTQLKDKRIVLYGFGFLSGLLFGFIMNVWSIISFYHPDSLWSACLIFASALPFDCLNGVATVILLVIIGEPLKKYFERISNRL